MKQTWKNLAVIIAAFALTSPLHANKKGLTPGYFQDTYSSDGQSCTMKLKNTFVSLSRRSGAFGEKLDFSIYCNGDFLHPEFKEGGTLIGCRQPYTTPNSRNPITKAMVNGKQIGWLLNTNESCGTQSLTLYALIRPDLKNGYYTSKKIISNYLGVLLQQRPDKQGINLWYSQYVYCGAGATAIPVPLMIHLDGEGKLPADFNQWPDSFKPTYVRAFLAGMADKNVNVLESAKKLLDEKTINDTEPCIANNVPRTKEKLEEIIEAMKILEKNNVTAYLSRPIE